MHSWFRKEVGKKVKEKTQKMFFLRGKETWGNNSLLLVWRKARKKVGTKKKGGRKGVKR